MALGNCKMQNDSNTLKIKLALKNPKKNNMQANRPYISTGLRHIFAIVSSQFPP